MRTGTQCVDDVERVGLFRFKLPLAALIFVDTFWVVLRLRITIRWMEARP